MADSIASLQVLNENSKRVTVKVVGATGPETNGTLVDASDYIGATGLTNLMSINRIDWNINDTGLVTLIWDGSSDVVATKLSRNGSWQLKRENNVKLTNNAPGANGDILVTSTTGNYTLLIELEKTGSGWAY